MHFLNVIIDNGNVLESDRTLLFPDDELVNTFRLDAGKDMFDLLVILGSFKSKGDARKNWKKTGKDIPSGWSHFEGIGKLRRELAIWNPSARDDV